MRKRNLVPVDERYVPIGCNVSAAIRAHKKAQAAVDRLAKTDFTDEENDRVCRIALNTLAAVAYSRSTNCKQAIQRLKYIAAEWRRMTDQDSEYNRLLNIAVTKLEC